MSQGKPLIHVSKFPRLMESLLRFWEDYWFLTHLENQSRIANGRTPVHFDVANNAPHFRKFVLEVQSGQSNFKVSDFIPEDKAVGEILDFLPASIATWSWNSRRVYHLSADMQIVLQATSLENLKWRDVRLPFRSYAVELNQPLADARGLEVGILMVSQDPMMKEPHLYIELYPADMEYVPIEPQLKQRFNRMVEQRNWNLLNQVAGREWKRIQQAWALFKSTAGIGGFGYEMLPDQNIFEGVANLDVTGILDPSVAELGRTFAKNIVRLSVGLAVYLQMLPPDTPLVSRAERARISNVSGSVGRAVTADAEIFDVASKIRLTHEERVLTGIEGTDEERTLLELSCHFREGHWRRPPGQGQNPEAAKIVHVVPTIVRRDRLPPGGLPLGAAKDLS